MKLLDRSLLITLMILFVTISVTFSDDFDPNDDTLAGATDLGVPSAVEQVHPLHDLSSTDLEDWYRVELTANETYTFAPIGDSVVFAELYNANGNLLFGSNIFDTQFEDITLTLTPPVGGTFFLRIRSLDDQSVSRYDLYYLNRSASGTPPDSSDPANDSTIGATILEAPAEAEQIIGPLTLSGTDREDWFQFELSGSVAYEIHSSGNYEPVADLYSLDGSTRLAGGSLLEDGRNFSVVFVPENSGTYLLRVKMRSEGRNGYYSLHYRVLDQQAEPGDAWDPADNVYEGATPVIPIEVQQNHGPHTLSETDRYDWFQFALEAEVLYRFSTSVGSNTTADFYDTDGETVLIPSENLIGGDSVTVDFAPKEDGTYYLRVAADEVDETEYQLSFICVGELPRTKPDEWDPADNELATATDLGQPFPFERVHGPHTLTNEDRVDWYRFELTAGETYEFTTSGDADTFGHLFASDGTTQLADDDDSGTAFNFRITITPETAGVYYLYARLADPGAAGTYLLVYKSVVIPPASGDQWDPADDVANGATDLLAPDTVSRGHGPHRIAPGDPADWYKFSLRAGWVYEFATSGEGDMFGELYLSDGSTVAVENDDDGDGDNFRIRFVPNSNESYLLKVTEQRGINTIYTLHYRGQQLTDAPPTTGTTSITPDFIFTLENVTEYTEVPGGFGGAAAGTVSVGAIPQDENGLSDGQGVVINVAGGQVSLLLLPTIEVGESVVVIRASVQVTGSAVAPALAVIDGSFDGSVATFIPAGGSAFVDGYKRMTIVYDSPGNETIVPVFQAASSGEEAVTVYLDAIEVYILPSEGDIPASLFYGN